MFVIICAALKLNNTEASLMAKHAGLRLVAFKMGLSLRTQMYGNGKLLNSKSIEETKNLLTPRLKTPPELNWMNQLSDRMYQKALINLEDALSRYRFGRSSYPTFADRRNGQSGALYLSNRIIVSHPNNTTIVSQKARKKPAKNQPHKHYGKSLIKIATLGTFDLDEPLNSSLVFQTFIVKKKASLWLVSLCDAESLPFPQPQKSVGINVGVKTFATENAIEESKAEGSNNHVFDGQKPLFPLNQLVRKLSENNRSRPKLLLRARIYCQRRTAA